MFFGFELIKHMLNNAVFVDKKSEAMNAVVLFAHKLLRPPHAKCIRHRVVFI